MGHRRQLRGLMRAREPRPLLTKSQWNLRESEAQEAGEGWECGAEASRGPSSLFVLPRLPLLPQLLRRPSWRLSGGSARPPVRPAREGICRVLGSGRGIATGRILTQVGSSWQMLASKSGGPYRQKLPNRKTVKDVVGDLCVALST